MNKLASPITRLLGLAIIRYFIMAAFVVGIELAVFAIMNSLFDINYLIATPSSMAVGIILNWYLSKKVVFKTSKYKPHVEFGLIVATSLVGVAIQLAVTSFSVEVLSLLPIIGKFLAIIVTFFWNFWVRKRFIFGNAETAVA